MNVFIASDHGGFELKAYLLKELGKDKNLKLEDCGSYSLDPGDDYPDYAFKLGEKVAKTKNSLGILICRSGVGMAVAVNKVKGARGCLILIPELAKRAREHDGLNVLCLAAEYADNKNNLEIAKSFLNTGFAVDGARTERDSRRVKKIEDYEGSN